AWGACFSGVCSRPATGLSVFARETPLPCSRDFRDQTPEGAPSLSRFVRKGEDFDFLKVHNFRQPKIEGFVRLSQPSVPEIELLASSLGRPAPHVPGRRLGQRANRTHGGRAEGACFYSECWRESQDLPGNRGDATERRRQAIHR